MIKVLTLTSVLIVSVTGQEDFTKWDPYYSPAPNTHERNPYAGHQWPNVLPGNYFDQAGFKKKSCPNRRNLNIPTNDQWIRTFHWKSDQPLSSPSKIINNKLLGTNGNNLQYQSLKGVDLVKNNEDLNVNEKNSLKCLTAGYQNKDPEQEQNQPGRDNYSSVDNTYADIFRLKPNINTAKDETTEHIKESEKCDNQNDKKQNQGYPDEISRLLPSRRFMPNSDGFKTSVDNDKQIMYYNELNKKNQFNDDIHKQEANVYLMPQMQRNDLKVKNTKVVSDNKGKLDSNITTTEKEPVGERKFESGAIENQLIEPVRGVRITNMSISRMILMDSSRVCYACSSVSDVTCWSPSRRTMVKYCRKGHDACVTRTYSSKEYKLIVIRDCSDSCDISLPILKSRYKSCSICKSDLCNNQYVDSNSGYSVNGCNAPFILFIALFIKYVI